MLRFALFACATTLTACASWEVTRRAADDLKCPDAAVYVEDGAAGAVHATGCGAWIDYSCGTDHDKVSCTELQRGREGANAERRATAVGSENGACFGNQTCSSPFVCSANVCVRPTRVVSRPRRCFAGTCPDGLTCVNSRCLPGSAIPAGTRSGACYPNQTCNTGLQCQKNVCVDIPPTAVAPVHSESGA